MYKFLLVIIIVFISYKSVSQDIKGTVFDDKTSQPVEGATVMLLPLKTVVVTDVTGRFIFKAGSKATSVQVNSIGYGIKIISVDELNKTGRITLAQQQTQLQDVIVVSNAGNQYRPITETDIAMRGVNNSQEILRIIPGVIIGQHQGGGKAEQIFLRGFDADHGTDFREDVDGLPINMVSHAHGQGFADSHFIIPETIENIDFKKGPYTTSKGDFATTGFVDFNTKNALASNVIKLEAGQFDTYRFLGMFNILNAQAMQKQHSWYAATEYRYSNAYFNDPQHFNRFNFFTKYHGKISEHNYLTISANTFWSKWDASGQIPDRAVDKGIIGFYGAIDPTEGGKTYRTNVNAQLVTSLNNGDLIKNQLYYSNSHFDLFTNFTFFLVDSVNGDDIRQKEARDLMGYNGSYNHTSYAENVRINTEAGINIRGDVTHNSELSHVKDRYTTIYGIKLGDVNEWDIAPYLSETFVFNEHFTINAGLRFDQYYFKYKNKLLGDSTLPGIGTYKADANKFSPKLNLYYHVNERTQFYLTAGRGFHSNDARAAVTNDGTETLPAAYGTDLGTVFKPAKNMIINAALWYIYLQQEFVYSGDGGFVEFSGKTRRLGFDFSGRYEPVKSLYFDVDVNYSHGRAIGEPKGENRIPLAPVLTSTAGLTYVNKSGLNGSLRYRFVGSRPANEDNSLTAKGYFITDAVLNYTKPRYELGLVVYNVFNNEWKETQFETETRLKNEAQPVTEVCFTPGTPIAYKLSFTYFFK